MLKPMEVTLDADQDALVQAAVRSGRLRNPEEAVFQGMALWEERERRRMEVCAVLDSAEASFARGEGRVVSSYEATRQLADDIKRRGLARVAAGKSRG